MWKVSLLLFVLGSCSLWIRAGASTALPEDDITTQAIEDGIATIHDEDSVTPAAGDESSEITSLTTLVPTSVESVTGREDEPTGSSHGQDESQHSTTLSTVTEEVSEETEITVEKDGLTTVTLIGIIIGVLLAIGFVGGVIFVVLRKMSGRYSP